MKQSTSYIIKQSHRLILIALLGITCPLLSAEPLTETLKACYLEQMLSSDVMRPVGEIERWCHQKLAKNGEAKITKLTPLEKRLQREKENRDNPNVITSHKRNYMLPFTYVDKPNNGPFANDTNQKLDNFEAKFQLSFKAPINESILQEDDMLYFGITIQSYWQVYNSEVSSPFRETNYQPEIFYGIFNDYKVGEWTNLVNVIGIEHQSNGRIQPFSRSWNRVYAQFVWENDNWLMMFKPWYRLPENTKADINQPSGDDNPDISDYMGYFEFSTIYKWDDQTFGGMFRNNLHSGKNRGAIQLDWTFPMGRRFKGYAQYFYGYGESLIDYNHSIQRLGIGVLLTDLF